MASIIIQNICGIERICAAPSELVGAGYCVPRVYTRGYILCLLQRHKNEGRITKSNTYAIMMNICQHLRPFNIVLNDCFKRRRASEPRRPGVKP
jgi:hypothetical protein